jgi:hypothetical protein
MRLLKKETISMHINALQHILALLKIKSGIVTGIGRECRPCLGCYRLVAW